MKTDFFDSKCSSQTNSSLLGLCDAKDKAPAFIDTINRKQWIAIIKNKQKINITFTTIDNCIPIYKTDGNLARRCDGMITYLDNIAFVELKEVRKDWIKNGINQLRQTILSFTQNHDLSTYRKKRAFLANRKHPSFQHSHKQEMQNFRNQLNVHLIIYNIIDL